MKDGIKYLRAFGIKKKKGFFKLTEKEKDRL